MTNERYYVFKMPNGSIEMLTLSEARKIENDPDIAKRVGQIIENSKAKRMLKDAFEPGWQENIRENISCPAVYKTRLKELGLVELGYDRVPVSSETTGNHLAGKEIATHAKEIGIDLTDNEMDAISDGSYFDSSKCDLSTSD